MSLACCRPTWRLETLVIDALAGLAFMPVGHISATWQGIALLAPLGGFFQVALLPVPSGAGE